ncbi:helix-turn-helix domain-containing protein [Sphingomonas montanisoli]|uniref:Helix-turn-helix domain-containing protein n=2 Tax=Sphingomonas montanisoli TaxID=2606412 RepID=A0A5D9BYH9_9SPHN|nr:helix-turn-helix domain-containing protein [Sphingomonas montanisoli]
MVHGLTEMLDVAGRFAVARDRAPLRVSHWQLRDGTVERSFDSHPDVKRRAVPDMLIAPGSMHNLISAEDAAPFARFLRDHHAQGALLASTCAGAFLLAETRLLEGRPATTHWYFADAFRDRFPGVRLEIDRMVIDDGDILTAGGLMAWTDLGLRIVERFLGQTLMMETAKFLLLDPGSREQRHYAPFAPKLTHGDEAILKVQHWLQAREARAVSVADMAREAHLEERTFLRRFKAATGLKPIEYVQHLRIGKARELLEFTKRSVEQIAWGVGYEDAAAFRKLFHRMIGLSPGDYRQKFAAPMEEAA